jgi:hypothetical protein
MKRTLTIAVSIISVLISSVFLVYGLFISTSDDVPILIMFFSVSTTLYGLVSISSLIWACSKGEYKAVKLIKYSAVVYVLIYIAGSMDMGIISGQEIAGVFLVSILLIINWYSVNRVAKMRSFSTNKQPNAIYNHSTMKNK